MTTAPQNSDDNLVSRESVLALAANAGLHLPDAYREELISAYSHVRRMVARLPRGPRSDEPAHVYAPARFQPMREEGHRG